MKSSQEQPLRTWLLSACFLAPVQGGELTETRDSPFDRVGINRLGVLTELPPDGLDMEEGLHLRLREGCAEWFGVRFATAAGELECAAAGVQPDWNGRAQPRSTFFRRTREQALSVCSFGPLSVMTRLAPDPDAPFLIANVRLTNTSNATVHDVVYSREWLEPGSQGQTFVPEHILLGDAVEGVHRRVWALHDIRPGESTGLNYSYRFPDPGSAAAGGSPDVPLRLFRNDDWPNGVALGFTNGTSFGDYDADGYIDIFSCESARLLRNEGGVTWSLAANLNSELPNANIRYGSAFGDYNNDGLPDIMTEPRNTNNSCVQLLKNLGGGPNFVNIAEDPELMIGQPCNADSETICWGDVDDDGDLDAFIPIYPPSLGSRGNAFLHNLGPTGPGGAYRMGEKAINVGLFNPNTAARPEGAQFLDVDFDGDMDLYSNGTMYQNRSRLDFPRFINQSQNGSGVGLSTALDEGAVFFDYDLDGDFDLFVVYTVEGVRIWRARGDGTYFGASQGLIDSPFTGLNLGMSAEDWDNDGDIDFTTRQVFRRNMLMETGQARFSVASTNIPANHLTSATPAWGDWDKDGDLDCALGNWLSRGHFYHNVTFRQVTPELDKNHVRVRVMRNSDTVTRGLETEYGAIVELRVHGQDGERRFKKFTSSANGYLNQNEYVLHFALPLDLDPQTGQKGVTFDVVVDFPGLQSRGILRVDPTVNPALGGIDITDLDEREIVVYRSGKVIVNDQPSAPVSTWEKRLTTTTDGLQRPMRSRALPGLTGAQGGQHFVGIEMTTEDAPGPVLVEEWLLDGRLENPTACSPEAKANLVVWDVTDPDAPLRIFAAAHETLPANRRSYYATQFLLQPDRIYRAVAQVDRYRLTSFAPNPQTGSVYVTGGLNFVDPDPCSGLNVVAALRDHDAAYLALRYREMHTGDER